MLVTLTQADGANPPGIYVRNSANNAWVLMSDSYVKKSGDTITGELSITNGDGVVYVRDMLLELTGTVLYLVR